MSHRAFRDPHGRSWEVWAVRPERLERRSPTSTRVVPGVERRKVAEWRPSLAQQWRGGWLAFETTGEKRRLAPIPDDWATMDDRELTTLCEKASPTKFKPRRLIE